MPSTYSSRLRVELQATGENATTWGTKANAVFNRLEEAIAASTSINMANGNVTLSTNNGTSDQARNMILIFTGANTATRTVTIPTSSKLYIIRNATSGGHAITISNGSDSVSVANGQWAIVWTDGTDVYSNAASFTVTVNGDNWSGTDLAVADGGTGASTASAARANLGLTIGSNVQAYDADLAAIAGLSKTNGNFIVGNGSAWVAESGSTARASLGLGSLATASTINNSDWSGTDLAVANGGTGSSNASGARSNLDAAYTGTTMSAGNGLTGGGSLASSRTFTLGTPSTITISTSNSVTSSSHTHSFSLSGARDSLIEEINTSGTGGSPNISLSSISSSGNKIWGGTHTFSTTIDGKANTAGTADAANGFNNNAELGGTYGGGLSGTKRMTVNVTSSIEWCASYADSTASRTHIFFENPNGVVGSISTSGAGTTYAETSDEDLKTFTGQYSEFDAVSVILADPVRNYIWNKSNKKGLGWGAQTSYKVHPELAEPGKGKFGEEGWRPWQIDKSKRTPFLWAALSWCIKKLMDFEKRLEKLEAGK